MNLVPFTSNVVASDNRAANAWRHGLRTRKVLVRAEEQLDFDTLRAALVDEWRPRNVTSWLLVDHLARLNWRLLRAGEAEADKLGRLQDDRNLGGDRTPPAGTAVAGTDIGNVGGTGDARPVPPPTGIASGVSAEAALAWDVGRAGSSLQRIQVFQMRLERAIHRTIALLIALRKLRGKRGNSRRTGPHKKSPQVMAGEGVAAKPCNKNGTNKNDPPAAT